MLALFPPKREEPDDNDKWIENMRARAANQQKRDEEAAKEDDGPEVWREFVLKKHRE